MAASAAAKAEARKRPDQRSSPAAAAAQGTRRTSNAIDANAVNIAAAEEDDFQG